MVLLIFLLDRHTGDKAQYKTLNYAKINLSKSLLFHGGRKTRMVKPNETTFTLHIYFAVIIMVQSRKNISK